MSYKVAVIVPGFMLSSERERYQAVGECFSSNGIEPVYIDLDWSPYLTKNIDAVRKRINEIISEHDNPELYLFGHSWGAVCCLATSADFEPQAQLLAGLSPEFQEEQDLIPPVYRKLRRIYMRVLHPFSTRPKRRGELPSLREIDREGTGRVYLFYGSREYGGLIGRLGGLNRRVIERRLEILTDPEEIVVENSTHMMDSSQYLEEICDVVEQQ